MTDLIKYKPGTMIDLNTLPAELQARIKQYAVIDILKDEVKADIQANRIDIDQYLTLWLKSKSERTRLSYRKAINDFFQWLNLNGIPHPLLIKAEHVDRYIDELRGRLKNNSVRLKACGVASFYTTMKRYGHISVNPFHRAELPRKEYKKAIKTDQNKTIPVMNEKEYKAIIKAIEKETRREGKHIAEANARGGAERLLPAVRVMAEYGLRVGAIPTIERKGNYFTYTTKGNKSFNADIKAGTLPEGKTPFKGYRVITIQKAFKRITDRLKDSGAIQYAYTCHDLRHYFAFRFYSQTKDIVRLKSLLGHASLNVTDIYIQSIGIK
jgi:site-specific recombinase XerD